MSSPAAACPPVCGSRLASAAVPSVVSKVCSKVCVPLVKDASRTSCKQEQQKAGVAIAASSGPAAAALADARPVPMRQHTPLLAMSTNSFAAEPGTPHEVRSTHLEVLIAPHGARQAAHRQAIRRLQIQLLLQAGRRARQASKLRVRLLFGVRRRPLRRPRIASPCPSGAALAASTRFRRRAAARRGHRAAHLQPFLSCRAHPPLCMAQAQAVGPRSSGRRGRRAGKAEECTQVPPRAAAAPLPRPRQNSPVWRRSSSCAVRTCSSACSVAGVRLTIPNTAASTTSASRSILMWEPARVRAAPARSRRAIPSAGGCRRRRRRRCRCPCQAPGASL